MKSFFLALIVIFTASAIAVPLTNHHTTRNNKTSGIAVPTGGDGAVSNDKVEKKGVASPNLHIHCSSTKSEACKNKSDGQHIKKAELVGQ